MILPVFTQVNFHHLYKPKVHSNRLQWGDERRHYLSLAPESSNQENCFLGVVCWTHRHKKGANDAIIILTAFLTPIWPTASQPTLYKLLWCGYRSTLPTVTKSCLGRWRIKRRYYCELFSHIYFTVHVYAWDRGCWFSRLTASARRWTSSTTFLSRA